MPSNFHRPGVNYVPESRPNDQQFKIYTSNLKRGIPDKVFDGQVGYIIDRLNQIDVRIDGISFGSLPGVADPINFGKFVTPDGAGSSSWSFVSAANVIDESLPGIKLIPQAITERELMDGGIPDTKIAPNAVTTIKILDQNVTSDKLADNCVITSKLADEAVTYDKMADNAVNTDILLNNAVTTPKIADANVTLAKLSGDVLNFINALVPIGCSMMWPPNSAPTNINGIVEWVEENGQLLNRVTYAALFAKIGTTYGAGDGVTTFAVPDSRGYTMVGIGSDNSTGGRITNATAPIISLGKTFGSQTHTININEMPSHSHSTTVNNQNVGNQPLPSGNICNLWVDGVSTGNTGGDQPHNNVQPSLFRKFYMRAK